MHAHTKFSLSMLHRTCENVHGGVRLGGLGMPNILQMLFILSQGVLRSTLSNMVKIELTNISIKRGLLTLM